ncbi:MAG: hypothetical protein U0792_10905 [Gemmataceae bacterium]
MNTREFCSSGRQSLWHEDQLACSYCGSFERPAAIQAPGPVRMWWLIGAVLIAAGIDQANGGHGWNAVKGWLQAK